MQIRLTTLGAVRIHLGHAEIPDLPAQRLRFALLLFLAVERDVARQDVLAMFWPDSDTARGKHALRQMLYELRQVLGQDWIDVQRDRLVVRADLDIDAFEQSIEAGDVAGALALYNGPFLHGFVLENRAFEGWADRRRAQLARIHRKLRREQIARLVAEGRGEDALAVARRWVELDPLEDEAAHTLIERLVAAGQRTAALRYYENYERQLKADLDVEPLEATTVLVAAVRAGEAPSEAAASLRPALAAPAPVPASGAGEGPVAPQNRPNRGRRIALWLPIAATLVVLAGAAILFTALVVRKPAATLPSNRNVRVAVLPFTADSTEPEHVVLTGMITDALVRRLFDVPFIEVQTPSTVALKRAAGQITDDTGRMFGADYLVGGAVTREDSRVVVHIDLTDARTGTVVRRDSVERTLADNPELLDDVAQGAARFLRDQLGRDVEIARIQAETENGEAWQLVLKAKAVQRETTDLLRAGQVDEVLRLLGVADSLLLRAATLDRAWAQPIVERAIVAERRAFVMGYVDPGDARATRNALLTRALALADTALQHNARSAAAHALRGNLFLQLAQNSTGEPAEVRGLLGQAESALGWAVEYDPADEWSWLYLAELYRSTGRYGQAEGAATKSYRIDPDGKHIARAINVLFAAALENGEDRKADGWCRDGRRRFPDSMPYLYCLLALHAWGDVPPEPDHIDAAMREYQAVDRRHQPNVGHMFEIMRATVYARAGRTGEARAILDRVPTDRNALELVWVRAAAHVALGDDAVAADMLADYLEHGGWQAPRVASSRPFWRLNGPPPIQRRITSAARAR